MVYYVRFETMITNPCLERWANTWIGWQTNLAWSSTHPKQHLNIRTFEKGNWTFDHWLFEVKKEIDWLNIKNTESQEVLYEYQHSAVTKSAVLYFMPLHPRLIIWSSEHFKSRKILAHCSKPESLKLIEQKPKMSPSHNKNLNGKTEYSIDLMP